MSIITWRDRDTRGAETGPTKYIQFDAVTVEEFARTANVTNYPIETGAILSDHYQPQPREISLVGVVSDTPVKTGPPLEGMQDQAALPAVSGFQREVQSATQARREAGLRVLRPVAGLPSRRLVRGNIDRGRFELPVLASVLWFTEPVTRIRDVFLVLDALMDTRTPVNVILFDTEFRDMMITNHRAPRLAGSGGEVRFVLDLQQVEAAEPTETSKAPESRTEPAVQQERNLGAGGTKPVESGTVDAANWTKNIPESVRSKSVLAP